MFLQCLATRLSITNTGLPLLAESRTRTDNIMFKILQSMSIVFVIQSNYATVSLILQSTLAQIIICTNIILSQLTCKLSLGPCMRVSRSANICSGRITHHWCLQIDKNRNNWRSNCLYKGNIFILLARILNGQRYKNEIFCKYIYCTFIYLILQ